MESSESILNRDPRKKIKLRKKVKIKAAVYVKNPLIFVIKEHVGHCKKLIIGQILLSFIQ